MMKTTSALLNKQIKKYQNEISLLKNALAENATYVAATIENVEDVKPDFDFFANYKRIVDLENKVMKMKHRLNLFNTSTKVNVDGIEYSIDELLVLMAQLTNRRMFLIGYVGFPQKKRVNSGNNLIEYKYPNFNPSELDAEDNAMFNKITNIQLELDSINNKIEFDIDDDLML